MVPVPVVMIYLAVIILVTGMLLLLAARGQEAKSGLPRGRIIRTDTMDRVPVEEPLYDAEFQLTGRPDYLVQDRSSIIPVEVKSSHVADTPHEGHILQLAAYCRLVETEFGIRPEYGIINYPDKSFRVDYTGDLQKRLHQELYELHQVENHPYVNRSHNSPGRCRMCGYRSICEEKLN